MNEIPELGDQCRDIASGREGVLTGFCEYLWGCEQFLMRITGEVDKDGDPKTVWLDVARIEVLEKNVLQPIDHFSTARPVPEQPAPDYAYTRLRPGFLRRALRPQLAFNGPDVEAPHR